MASMFSPFLAVCLAWLAQGQVEDCSVSQNLLQRKTSTALKQDIESLSEDIFQKEVEQVASQDVVKIAPKSHDRFESCSSRVSPKMLDVTTDLNRSADVTKCNDKTEVALFEAKDASPFFAVHCCPAKEKFCAGCAKMNSGKTACDVCGGGYTKTSSGNCLACADFPGWVNKAGDNCYKASCSGELFQGFSSNQACCKCGGGQTTATKFIYYVGPMALGSTEVLGHPVPRTASHYSVDKDCELSKFGLSIDAGTGELKLAPGCSALGCGATATIEVKCTITAWQSDGLFASSPLFVTVGHVGYGNAVVLEEGTSSLAPASDSTGSFQVNCAPQADEWLSVDSSGVLSLKSGAGNGGSLTDQSGIDLGRGGMCSVQHGIHQTQVMVLAPKAWASISYSYGASTLLYATVGERSPVLPVKAHAGVPPSRYSASCAGGAFAFDELTGIATWEGHEIFVLDVQSGDLQMQPEESLTRTLDATDVNAVRRKINLQCTIFGHYEWLPAGQGPILTHSLHLELRDQTCWAKKKLSFAKRHHKGSKSESDCRSSCRSDVTCSHFHVNGNECYFFSGICKRVTDFACKYQDEWVYEHYPGCGERGSCIDIKLPDFHYISGKYCPRGENVAVTGQGPVYFKQGLTTQETFWLQRYDTARSDSACADGDWAILKPAPQKDYENMTMGYVELHGTIVVCLKSPSSDLPTDVFSNPETHLTVKKISVNGARAVVAAPGCQKPNITGKDKTEVEEEEDLSVFPLVFDDPSTDAANDHWLHPCQCVPAEWGSLPPAAGDSVGGIPPGSNNEFIVPPFQIVEGEFVCEQENLIEILVLPEDEGLDSGACRTKCLAQQCPYFWEGEVMSSRQCRIYRACGELVRELGTAGTLYGVSYRKSCQIADPQMCWDVTKRRSFLGAGSDSYSCLFQDLLEQCDHKLMLGGMGVGVCGKCTFAPVEGRRIAASNGECIDYDPGNSNVKVHPCHGDKNQKWYFDGELLKTDYSDSCMDYHTGTGNVYMYTCHGEPNQRWYFDGNLIKSRFDDRCLQFQAITKDVFIANCPGTNTQHWTWQQTVHDGQRLHTDHDHGRCLHVDSDGNLKMANCDVSMKSRFFFSGEALKSEWDAGSQCVDYHPTVSNMYMHSCHSGNNQKFYWDGKYLKNRNDDRCVDWSPHTGNVYMGNCPNSPTRRWSMHQIAAPMPHVEMTVMSDGKCWDMAMDESKNVYLADCHGGANQKFYFDGELIKVEHNGECLDEGGDGNNLYIHPCHGGDNQKFYWNGHQLHNRKWGSAKCVDYGGSGGNLYMHACHAGANQLFNWKTPLRIKSRKDPGWCLDYDSSSKNAYFYPCHDQSNQLFWFDGARLKVESDHGRCLDLSSSGNLYFHNCHGGDNQKFFWSGEQLKVVSDTSKCWTWAQGDNNNLVATSCSSNDDLQKFYFDTPHYQGKRLQSEASANCLDAHAGNAYTVGCHDGSWQRWYFEGEQIKVEGDSNKCLDYWTGAGNTENGNVHLHDCHGGSNQKWYWDGNLLKSRNDNRCLDVNPGDNNVFVGSCPNDNTQHWTHRTDLHNSRQLTVGGGKCLKDMENNVEAAGCGSDASLMWYFDSDERLKREGSDRCLDVHTGTGSLYMGSCHGGGNQKFYFDGNYLKTRMDDLCIDYQIFTGDVQAAGCPHHQMSSYQMEGGAMLKKIPLPEEFVHGQTLEVKCWSERFASPQTDSLSCVAGHWMNSRGKPGLDGFSCAACVQVVTPRYAALDAQIRQELFFADGLQLHMTVDTRTPRSVTSNGNLRAGGSKDVFVAELLPDAEETMRRYRSITNQGQCLTATSNNRLTAEACGSEAEPLQMLQAMELSSLMWEEFKAGANVPSESSSYLANRGSAPTTLRSFVLNGDCGEHVMTSVGFYHGTRLGMTSACTAASTYGDHVEHHMVVDGHVQISSVSTGGCLSIHHIVPWELKDRWSNKCMDYHTGNNNVYAHDCHGNNNQLWYMIDGTILSLADGKCLDYHTGTNNVYMHDCHDGNNQRWYFDQDTAQIRSEYDHRCLDVTMDGSLNIYIHPCHDGNNQKFDRHEKGGSAFNKPLHLQCSGAVEENIKVEPIGSENKFNLKSEGHQLPGEWRFDTGKKRIQNIHSNKCLKAHHPNTAEEEPCMESVEQEWVIGHGLQGLADAPVTCESNQVISFIEKGHGHIRYKCVHVAALGSCVPGYSSQVDTKALELEDVKALKKMTATCPIGHGLRKLEAEASDKGAWIRLRYECCEINRVPVSLYPYMAGGDHREFKSDLAHGWEGVYCPSSEDDSGRLQFTQSRSFRPHHGASGSLHYDKFQGQWCVSGKTCSSSDVVHPLDVALSTHEWHVVPVSDFDAKFEARGVKPLSGNRKRSPPPLITFGASDPDYLPECKDESHPGARKFKLELMNKEAEDLDDENPCKYVFGKPPQNQKMDGSEGMTGWIDDLSGTTEPGQGGVTYKSVKECSDRDIVRELKLAKWNQEHWDATKYNWIPEDILDGIGNSIELETAPMGFGMAFNPFAAVATIGQMVVHGVEMHYDQQIEDRDMHFEQAGHDDCNPIQHGFARTFCDLHCIRDAVRKGDDAILGALEEAVEIVGKNTQILLEHYVGEDSQSGLLEKGQQIKHGIAQSMGEMLAIAQEAALEPRASVAATRAINLFTNRWSGANVSEMVPRLVSELQNLRVTIAKLSSRKLSGAEEVQRYAVQTAMQMTNYMKAQSHTLGIYHHEAKASKLLQHRLNRLWRSSVTSSALLLEVEEESAEADVKEFDAMWWEIRQELDGYLQASQEYVTATQTAAGMLRDYSAMCTSGFAELKRAYTLSARAETRAHKILKSAWAAVSTGIGEMASKVVDGAILDHLALHDLRSLNPKQMLSTLNGTDEFCFGDVEAAFVLVESATKAALKDGVFGQTHRQLMVLFEELNMLQSRFRSGRLGPPPDVDLVKEAQSRLQSAFLRSTRASGKVAKAMVQRIRRSCDAPQKGSGASTQSLS